VSRAPALALAAALGLGCTRPYLGPAAGMPSAQLWVRVAVDPARVAALVPESAHGAALEARVVAKEPGGATVLASRRWPGDPVRPPAVGLEALGASLHPGRSVTVEVRLSLMWMVTTLESRFDGEPVTRHLVLTESPCDPLAPLQPCAAAADEYFAVGVPERAPMGRAPRRLVTREVTRDFSAGCTAQVALQPQADAVYLVDYASAAVVEGCTARAFVEVRGRDDSVEYQPLSGLGP
jgi:hypothetical protein